MITLSEEQVRRAASGEAEFELIGSLLLDGNAIDEIGSLVRQDHFRSESLGLIYAQLMKLRSEDKKTDAEAIAAALGNDEATTQDLIQINGHGAEFRARRLVCTARYRCVQTQIVSPLGNADNCRVDAS